MIGQLLAFSCRIVFLIACGLFAVRRRPDRRTVPLRPPGRRGGDGVAADASRVRLRLVARLGHHSRHAGDRTRRAAGRRRADPRPLPAREAVQAGRRCSACSRRGSAREAACRMFLAAFFGTKWYADA